MATKLPGETYLGHSLHVPLSKDGQVAAYVWPLRILRTNKAGGPTIGVEVANEEVLRFDCHDEPGHWHSHGYDKLGAGGSHVDFPEGMTSAAEQITWSLQQIKEKGKELLEQAEHGSAAQTLDPSLVQASLASIKAHLENEGDLRAKAIADKLITA